MSDVQYQNLEPNRGMYRNFKFPIAKFQEFPKWVPTGKGDEKVLCQNAAEERTIVLARDAGPEVEGGEVSPALVLERNALASRVSELSQALAEAKAQPELLLREMAEMRKQMGEMSKQLLAIKTAPAPQKALPESAKQPAKEPALAS